MPTTPTPSRLLIRNPDASSRPRLRSLQRQHIRRPDRREVHHSPDELRPGNRRLYRLQIERAHNQVLIDIRGNPHTQISRRGRVRQRSHRNKVHPSQRILTYCLSEFILPEASIGTPGSPARICFTAFFTCGGVMLSSKIDSAPPAIA